GFFGGPPNGEDLSGYTKLDAGVYNPLLGVGYGEMAAASRSMHKSQGFGQAPSRGPAIGYFQLLDRPPTQKSILDGGDFSWARVPGSEKLRKLFEKARADFKPTDPGATVPVLLEALSALDALPDSPFKAEKRAELGEVIAACAGLFVDATAAE